MRVKYEIKREWALVTMWNNNIFISKCYWVTNEAESTLTLTRLTSESTGYRQTQSLSSFSSQHYIPPFHQRVISTMLYNAVEKLFCLQEPGAEFSARFISNAWDALAGDVHNMLAQPLPLPHNRCCASIQSSEKHLLWCRKCGMILWNDHLVV